MKESNTSLQSKAQSLWVHVYSELEKKLIKGINKKKDRHYINYIQAVKNLPKNNSYAIERLKLNYLYLVKPFLPWKKIKDVLKDISLDDKKIGLIILYLKPTPIEQTLIRA